MPANAFAPEPRNAMLRPYQPTWKEQIAALLMGDTRPSPERRQFSQGIADILGYLPGTGNVLQGQEAAAKGDTKGALMAMLPLAPAARIPAQVEQQAVKQGIRAFHGSPHDFPAFDMSKVGTGEGNQAFSYGLYFAGHEPVAEGYREALAPFGRGADPEDIAARVLLAHKGDRDAAMNELRNRVNTSLARGGSYEGAQKLMQARNIVNTNPGVAGHMYEVNIKANPEDFLDWDKSLSAQPTIRDKLLTPEIRQGISDYRKGWGLSPVNESASNITGEELMAYLEQPVYATEGNPKAAAEFVKQAGVPGVKYLDRGSRSAGEGTYNYVVNDDRLVEIMRKYGLMGAVGAGIAAKILARQDARQEM